MECIQLTFTADAVLVVLLATVLFVGGVCLGLRFRPRYPRS